MPRIFILILLTSLPFLASANCNKSLKEIQIVVGVLMNENSEVLLGKRQPPQDWVGYWEFPGGKVESDESAEEALIREMKEEVGIDVHIESLLDEALQVFDGKTLRMRFYLVSSPEPIPQAIAHSEVAWVGPKRLSQIPFLVPDHPIFKKIW